MIFSPLEQFEVLVLPFNFEPLLITGLTIRGFIVCVLLNLFVSLLFSRSAPANIFLVPNRWQLLIELFTSIVWSIVNESAGKQGKGFFPIIFAIFSFLLIANVIGLLPYSFTVTAQLVITLTVALIVWLMKLIAGFQLHGLKLFGIFLPSGIPFAIVPFLVSIEILGFFIVLVRLPVRLFSNIVAGHILLKVLGGFAWTMMLGSSLIYVSHFLPIAVLCVLIGLETGVALIQAYVFSVLTCLYLGDMLKGGH